MSVVLYERQGSVAVITLNRPEARNAMSPEVLVRLADIWDEVATDDEVRVAVITGAGDQAFCAGADLARLIPLMSGAKQPADEFDPSWDPKGFVADGTLLFELGEKLANSRIWPEWKAGSEFKAERDKTKALRK